MTDFRSQLRGDQLRALERFEARCGRFGDRERRAITFTEAGVEIRDAGEGADTFTVRGHAAVYKRKSLDLGGFQEVIDPGAFTRVLDENPHVILNWNHDENRHLASTKTNRLELREDPKGLHFWARIVPGLSYAQDLRRLMEEGEVDQASFAFTIGSDTWEIRNEGRDDEQIVRTIHEIDALYDVTITAMGAYPQTDSQVVRDYALSWARDHGRLPEEGGAEGCPEDAGSPETVAPEGVGVEENPSRDAGGETQPEVTEPTLLEEKRQAREAVMAAKTRFLLTERKIR